MRVRYFALVLGILYTVAGVAGFIPPLIVPMHGEPHRMLVNSLSGLLLGVFPVNILHTLVHLGVGIWGIAAYRSFTGSIVFSKTVSVIFAVLTVMGLIPLLSSTFGLIPLWGADVMLHAATALVAGYFGFYVPVERPIDINR
ncbi:MAG TPA: DUF4383 domain-containing protein [Deltaproteobacteria bacterium]|jgi:hypothetical protein|nr:DUF4383 domain-containing protein [Deltaproteobacteria bacterium]HOI06195.1 DUF4383 domain-containing protein [Deltaproteobacteria bacterium]